MSYRDRFGGRTATRSSRRGEKPECFGDTGEYEPRSTMCRRCNYRRTCGVIVQRKLASQDEEEDRERERARKSRYRGRNIPVDPDPADFEERDDDGGLGFFGALAMNGALSGLRAGLIEAIYAIDEIPRVPYEDPFEKALSRGREKGKRRKD